MDKLKLTLISVNGKARFFNLPYGEDGRCRVDHSSLMKTFKIPRGSCVTIG